MSTWTIWQEPERKMGISYETKNRTAHSVDVRFTYTYTLVNSSGYSGYACYVKPTLNSVARSEIRIKSSSPSSWYGDPIKVTSEWYTVNVRNDATSFPAVFVFRTTDPADSNITKSVAVEFEVYACTSVLNPINDFSLTENSSLKVSYEADAGENISHKLIVECDGEEIKTFDNFESGQEILSDCKSELYRKMSNKTTAKLLFTLNTCSADGNETYGTSFEEAIVTIPEVEHKPLFVRNELTVTSNSSPYVLKGFSSVCISGFEANAKNSAEICSYEVSAGGKTILINDYEPVTFENVDSENVYVKVKDSRGYTNTISHTIDNFKDYEAPSISKFNVIRMLNPDEHQHTVQTAVFEFSYCRITDDGTGAEYDGVSEINTEVNEIKSIEVFYGESDAGVVDESLKYNILLTDEMNDLHTVSTVLSNDLAVSKTYSFKLVITDTVNNYASKTVVMSASPALDVDVENSVIGVGEMFSGDEEVHSASFAKGIKLGRPLSVGFGGTGVTTEDDFAKMIVENAASEIEKAIFSTIAKKIYPVGAIYTSTKETSPANLFGFGTWQQISGRFLLGNGGSYAAGSTGGLAEVSLTVANLPAHTHTSPGAYTNLSSGSTPLPEIFRNTSKATHNITTSSTGSGVAHNNMPPYLVVYMWKRTA